MEKKRNVIAILLAVSLLLGGCAGFRLTADTVTVEAGDTFDPREYLEKGSEQLQISGDVDTHTPGTYTVTYSLGNNVQELTVTVQDTVAPVVEAAADPVVMTLGEEILPEKLVKITDATSTAARLGDEDLTAAGNHTVTVTVTDGGGNSTVCTVNLLLEEPDTTPPVFAGTEDVYLALGSQFDPAAGVSVTDDRTSSPAWSYDAEGFRADQAGTYQIRYTASDDAGNQACVTRSVTVYYPQVTPKPADPPSCENYIPTGGTVGWDATGIAGQPYLVAVNRACCTTTVYGKDGNGNYTVPVKAIVCSVGRAGEETPLGRYTTGFRAQWCLMQDGSHGRYAIRIVRGIMFHSVCYYTENIWDLEYGEYNKLGSPASLGCIRMCLTDVKWIYDNCPAGFTVVIYDDTALPGPLGKPTPIHIDENDELRRGWDPTDWYPGNPWRQ